MMLLFKSMDAVLHSRTAVVLCVWFLVNSCQCVDPELSQCQCVSVYKCDFTPSGHTTTGLIDVRVDQSCPDLLEVCCPIEDIQSDTPPPTVPSTCGRSIKREGTFRITDDSEARYGQFPWMAALLKPGRIFICGGSLIHPRVVMTAAHCVADLNTQITVRLGEWDSQSANEPLPLQNRVVSEIVMHEQFTPGSLFNDIALLFLESPADIGDSVATVCLPPPNQNMDGRRCLASGWGKDAFGGEGQYADILRSVEVPIVPWDKCQDSLRSDRLGQFFKLHISFLCAGGEKGQDTCKGDGGGPLVCPMEDNLSIYEQVGIVSWGLDCGRQVPGVYTNVALFRSWIDLKLLQNGLSLA